MTAPPDRCRPSPVSDTISAVLPLKISGRHYAGNLNRCDLLFSTMRHFGLAATLAEILIVVPDSEYATIARHADGWSDFPIRLIAEDSFLNLFRQYNKFYEVRPWHRQQIIKLFCARLVSTPFFLTLDPDVLALRHFGYGDLVRDGRALIEPEARTVHGDWWRASASLLGLDPALSGPGMSVTPAVLASDICLALMQHLETRHAKEWYRVLLENYAINWSEYTLYYLVAESSGLLDRRHRVPEPGEPRLLAPYRVFSRSAFDPERLAALFSAPQRDLFSVLQSNTRVDAARIASIIAPYVPITLQQSETPAARPIHRLPEMMGVAVRKVMWRPRRHG